MKKIVLCLGVVSSLAMATQLQDDIKSAKADVKKAQKRVKELELKLPNEMLTTHTELGFISTGGNTKTKTFALDLKAKKGWGAHLLSFDFDAQYAQDKDIESKNKFSTQLKYSRSFTDRLSATYLIAYKKDKFSGFSYQTYTGPGLKYVAIEKKEHKLTLNASILYSQDDIEDINYDTNGDIIKYPNPNATQSVSTKDGTTKKYAAYELDGAYAWQMLDNLKFEQELTYRAEVEDSSIYFGFSKTALSSKLSDMFSAGISYKADYVNTPPIGKDYTDTTFTVNLIIDY
ncbi:MAG: DUF481 domain-containing protein [Sulfurimonas sp.]|nr:DUF481 domain-containing protein [Sulfurimonas sp.]